MGLTENNASFKGRLSAKDLIICSMSELFGTSVLLFLSCTGVTKVQEEVSLLHGSMAAGLAVAIVIQMLGHISGAYVNPVVTLSAYILDEINLMQALAYVICQVVGSLCGTGFHRLLTPNHELGGGLNGHAICVNSPGRGIGDVEAFGIEIILTIILVVANCSSWDKRNSHKSDSVPIKIGLVVVGLNVSAAAYTGASMNPARSFGPAVWSSDYNSHWVYWAGPTIGSLLASYTYKYIFMEKDN